MASFLLPACFRPVFQPAKFVACKDTEYLIGVTAADLILEFFSLIRSVLGLNVSKDQDSRPLGRSVYLDD